MQNVCENIKNHESTLLKKIQINIFTTNILVRSILKRERLFGKMSENMF
jgi:hypothetical protein